MSYGSVLSLLMGPAPSTRLDVAVRAIEKQEEAMSLDAARDADGFVFTAL